MLGISFGGGLSIVAAGRPSVRDRVAFVMAFGGHADLPRTLRYLCTGVQPDGAVRPPHDYGLAIVLLGAADRVVPAAQVQPLRDAILSFLEASRLDMVDKAKAAQEFERAKRSKRRSTEPSRTYMNVRERARRRAPGTGAAAARRRSRRRSGAVAGALSVPRRPVFCCTAADDNVVPAIESTLLGEELRSRGVTCHVLLTPLITHAEVDRGPTASPRFWRLIDFWADVLHE